MPLHKEYELITAIGYQQVTIQMKTFVKYQTLNSFWNSTVPILWWSPQYQWDKSEKYWSIYHINMIQIVIKQHKEKNSMCKYYLLN